MDDENDLSGATSVTPPVIEQKAITQEELDRVVKREKAETAARVRQELELAHRAELEKLKTGQTQNLGGMTDSVDPNKIYEQVAGKFREEMQLEQDRQAKAQHEAEMKRIADNYFSKLSTGKDRYNDFDEMVGDFDHTAFPQLVWAVSGMDNAADVIYELNKSPAKLEQIDYWLNKSPTKGLKMLHTFSDSIRQVQTAENEYEPTNPPLSQVKPSNAGADSRTGSLEDLKRDPSLMF